MSNTVISSSLEDYLEAIAEIIENNGHAHTKDIADRLQVKMPSVTNALQSLAGRGLIHYQSHSPVVLTSRGAELAAVIRHRHTVLKGFFSGLLKLDSAEADDTACKIEHVIGETVLSRIVLLVEAIADRDDCAPLREYLENTMFAQIALYTAVAYVITFVVFQTGSALEIGTKNFVPPEVVATTPTSAVPSGEGR